MVEQSGRANDLSADRRLAGRIVEGDEAAFDELLARYYGGIARLVGRFFRQPETIEEIAQGVFVKAYVRMADYRAKTPLADWLARISVNACYDRLGRTKRKPEAPLSRLVDDPVEFYMRLQAPPGSPERVSWDREDARSCADELLAMLAPAERLVLTLMVLEELSVIEVADLTGWSVANVKIRAFSARSRLHRLLAEDIRSRKGRNGDVLESQS